MAKKTPVPAIELSEEDMKRITSQAKGMFGGRQGYSGAAVMYDLETGPAPSKPRVHVFFDNKSSVAEAAEAAAPETIEGLPIVVEEKTFNPDAVGLDLVTVRPPESPEVAPVPNTRRYTKLQPGISVGHRNITAGTFGLLVNDKASGKPAVLSNWHVLAGSAAAKKGDAILQPGPIDDGALATDTIGALERWLLDADGDAAVAILNGKRPAIAAQFDTGVVVKGVRPPKIGERVAKSGRTTRMTEGVVRGFGEVVINYSVGPKTINGYFIRPVDEKNPLDLEVSKGGDSGACWYSVDTKEAVALHFAGETDPRPEEEHAIACNLVKVMDRLNLELPPSVETKESDGDVTTRLAAELGDLVTATVQQNVSPQQFRRYVDAMLGKYPWLGKAGAQTEEAEPDIAPLGAAVIGFAAGAAARLLGKAQTTPTPASAEALPILVTAFIVGAVAGSRAVDGKL